MDLFSCLLLFETFSCLWLYHAQTTYPYNFSCYLQKEFARYKQAKSWKHLVVYKSGIHALGLYTSRFISRDEMVWYFYFLIGTYFPIIAKMMYISLGFCRLLSMLERLWGNVLLIKGKININPEKNFSTRAHATSSG